LLLNRDVKIELIGKIVIIMKIMKIMGKIMEKIVMKIMKNLKILMCKYAELTH
jgi:hypothetical protein